MTRPTTTLVEQLAAAALAAPSMHNSQPWRISVKDDHVELRIDGHRLAPISDPDGRGLYLAAGAALLNMRLTAKALGQEPMMWTRPHPADPGLIAVVRVSSRDAASEEEQELADAIHLRHTNRYPFRDKPIPDDLQAKLAIAAEVEGAALRKLNQHETPHVLGLVRQADRMLRTDPLYIAELAYWTGLDERRPVGIPASAFGPLVDGKTLPLRDFGLAKPGLKRRAARFESAPAIFVVSTVDDDPNAWLHAGLALQRVLLAATANDVSASFLYQPLQIPLLRARLRAVMGRRTYPQMITRLGYGPPVSGTRRRPVSDVLEWEPE